MCGHAVLHGKASGEEPAVSLHCITPYLLSKAWSLIGSELDSSVSLARQLVLEIGSLPATDWAAALGTNLHGC